MINASFLVLGMLAMGFVVIGILFLKFWQKSHDRLFAAFALAFFIFAAERIALGIVGFGSPYIENFIWVRLLGSALILVAIIDKNRVSTKRDAKPR